MVSSLQRIVGAGVVAAGLAAGGSAPVGAAPLPAASVEQVAGAKLTEQVYWYGWGPGWGAALATGAVVDRKSVV